jgi:HEAT repeat protein
MAGGMAWLALRPREPVYLGKPASVWVNSLQNGFEPGAWRPLGTNAVPLLIQALGKRDGPFAKLYFKVWLRLPAVLKKKAPKPVDAERVRSEGANAFDWYRGGSRLAVPALVRALEDESPTVRLNAASALGRICSNEKDLLQVSKQAMNNRNMAVRANIVETLNICPWPEEVTPLALRALKDPAPEVRFIAAKLLMRMDAQKAVKEGVVPLILKFQSITNQSMVRHDDDFQVLSKAPALVTPPLVEALENQDPAIRTSATNMLKFINPGAATKAGVK